MTRRFDETQREYVERLRDELLRRVHVLFRSADDRPWNLKQLEDAHREYADALRDEEEGSA